ncbi:hypothetical protein [Actinomadura sp. BRA 177]|uniref:hypothetical protein n=1 Tax=Actinomadura sp. BRA 177 TaxID=2745202 RepID=UPI00159611C7|nr:hypothetical protein [Actinomadura sp. BRA 177]NVI91451.1 hypothetical protein [Actinomadura sp. BRA 177]
MATRPTVYWRQIVADEARQLASGELDPECAGIAELFPESMLVRTDQVLRRFEADLAALNSPSDEDVFRAIKQVVRTLNEVNEEYDHAAYETGEREQLCDYIDKSLTETGVDVEALAARRGLKRYEITDEWREW